MGGDFGPHCIVPASVRALEEFPSLQLILVGQSSSIEESLLRYPDVDRSRVCVLHASEEIAMDEQPAQALRSKPDASMRVALEQVQQGVANACVSAGNTGALMALSRYILKTLPGIDRPAMITSIPTRSGHSYLLDLGANVDCSAEHLYQFAVMGAVAAEALGVECPRVALLNVGKEEIKGNQQVKLAATLLQQVKGLNYIGYVEGDGLFRGEADVIVCDGFVGNILLKSNEGLLAMIIPRVEEVFRNGLIARAVGLLALPLLQQLRSELSPARYNGASFLGLQGIVIKSHGSAGEDGFLSAIRCAVQEMQENLPQRLHHRLEDLFS